MLIQSNKRGHCTHCENTQQKNSFHLHRVLGGKKKYNSTSQSPEQTEPNQSPIGTAAADGTSTFSPWRRISTLWRLLPSVSGPLPEYFSFGCRIDLHRAVCGRCSTDARRAGGPTFKGAMPRLRSLATRSFPSLLVCCVKKALRPWFLVHAGHLALSYQAFRWCHSAAYRVFMQKFIMHGLMCHDLKSPLPSPDA